MSRKQHFKHSNRFPFRTLRQLQFNLRYSQLIILKLLYCLLQLFISIILQVQHHSPTSFYFRYPPSAISLSSPSFCNTSNSTIRHPILFNYLYLTLSLISRTCYPPEAIRHQKPPIIFKFLQYLSLHVGKI